MPGIYSAWLWEYGLDVRRADVIVMRRVTQRRINTEAQILIGVTPAYISRYAVVTLSVRRRIYAPDS